MNDGMLRREFTSKSILALLGGVVITITGCNGAYSSSSPTSPTSSPPDPGDVSGVVTANHGHVAIVTGVQIAAANAVVLDIMGAANHSHLVELSAGELSLIGAGQKVSKQSSTDLGHNHMVTFN